MRVVVAMSGGVDSSVAAARLVAAGHEVIGVTLHLWDYPDDGAPSGRCCAPEDVHDARRVADQLGIPHYAFDRRAPFLRDVVEPFVEAYLAGTTPSPCVACNRGVKLAELVRIADSLDAPRLATGHYARVVRDDQGIHLERAADASKDQSYFLHTVRPDVLARLDLPLGEATKLEVRAEALARSLHGAAKGESQELCFVSHGRYADFVADRASGRVRPGRIVDRQGRAVGAHEGVHGFTVGQRKGLGVALGRPAYVVDVDVDTATVTLGDRADLATDEAWLDDVTLAPSARLPLTCDVVVRYRGRPVAARVEIDARGRCVVRFDGDPGVVVSGQYAVFYAGARVLGGGRIAGCSRRGAPS